MKKILAICCLFSLIKTSAQNTWTIDPNGSVSTATLGDVKINTTNMNNVPDFQINRQLSLSLPWNKGYFHINEIQANGTITPIFNVHYTKRIGLNTIPNEATLDINSLTTNHNWKYFNFASKANNRSFFYVNNLSVGSYNPITQTGDHGIFWTDALATVSTPPTYNPETGVTTLGTDYYYNGSSAFVIAPYNTSLAGLRILADGKIGVNTANPVSSFNIEGGSLTLTQGGTVNCGMTETGLIWARELKLNLDPISVPDYVFANNYKLMPLKQLGNYIQTNHHLPGVPSAVDFKAVGTYNVAEFQFKLLEKVEELTLYVLQLKKENEELKQMIQAK